MGQCELLQGRKPLVLTRPERPERLRSEIGWRACLAMSMTGDNGDAGRCGHLDTAATQTTRSTNCAGECRLLSSPLSCLFTRRPLLARMAFDKQCLPSAELSAKAVICVWRPQQQGWREGWRVSNDLLWPHLTAVSTMDFCSALQG